MKLLKSLALLGAAALFVLASAHVVAAADEAKPADAKATATKAAGHEYIGSKGCKACHMGAAKGTVFEIWEKSKHATATASLPAESKKDGKCLGCHATGYGKPTGYDPAVPATAGLEGVGCEACHGPGKDYKAMSIMKDKAKAVEAGLIMPEAANCKTCHEGAVPEGHKALPKFEFATMMPKVAHTVPKK
jgi:hypothetical protein